MADLVFPTVPTAPTGTSGDYRKYTSAFPDPFFDYASTQMPRSLYDVLRWCEFVWLTNGTYRTACQRIVRYFLTKVELEDVDDEEKEKYDEFLTHQMKIIDILATIGDDWMCYGNSFSSIWLPFRRYLRCPNEQCNHERAIEKIDFKFDDWEFHATCPVCGTQGKFIRVDRRSVEQDKIKVVRWSPHEIRLLYHPVSHEVIYYWVPPADFKRQIKKGNKFYISSTPWEIIEAIKKDAMFQFNKGVIYHMKEETVAGLRNAGWGIPRVLANFRQMWSVQVLKRYNEAIGLDYIIPFRVITPGKGAGSGETDPLYHMNIGSFLAKVMGMIRRHRRDPAQWNALPFPVEYQALGGEGQQLAPHELIATEMDELLNAMGFPAEMFKATLQVQAAPMALRLFERTWTSLTSALNGWINWFFDQITDVLNWEKLSGRLQPTTLAEDIEKKQVQLQLAAAQQVSKQTAYAPFGIDYRQEIRRMFEEEKFFGEESARFQKEQAKSQEMEQTFEAAQQAANAPPGQMPPMGAGAPAPAGAMPGGAPAGAAGGTTPNDLMMQAEQIAMQMLGMPYEIRKSQLNQMKKADETLHALVIQKMETIRRQAQHEGGFQMIQQMAGAQAG
jgi:hypothetical protein